MKDIHLLYGVVTQDEYIQYLHNMVFHYATLGITAENARTIQSYAEELADELIKIDQDDLLQQIATDCMTRDLEPEPITTVEKTPVKSSIKFNVGDRVAVYTNRACGRKYDFGTIVLIEDKYEHLSKIYYLIELDDRTYGWTATVEREGIDCHNVWRAREHSMVLVKDFLKKDKWYDCYDYTLEQLHELLPTNTVIQVSPLDDEEETNIIEKILEKHTVDNIINYEGHPLIILSNGSHRRHFKITGENK